MWRARAVDDFATIRMRIERLGRERVEALGADDAGRTRTAEQRLEGGLSRFVTWRSGG
jgi:hypothetical protein